MLTILSHKGNANENYTKILFHPSQIDNYRKTNNSKCWEGCQGIKEPSYTIGEM
jgi:hypothetical protein